MIEEKDYPHITVEREPLTFLTNQGCEDTGYWTPEQFDALGLAYGEWQGEPYPLTDKEAIYISWDHVTTPAGGELMFGYTALWQGKKWVTPCIEYYYGGEVEPSSQMRQEIEEERISLSALVSPYRGWVIEDKEGPDDRIILMIMVPYPFMQEAFNSVQDWMRYLERGLGIEKED